MTRLTAALLLGLAALPVHAASTALHCERLFDSLGGRMLDARTIVARDGKIAMLPGRAAVAEVRIVDIVYRSPAP